MTGSRNRPIPLILLAFCAGFLLSASACSKAGFHTSDVYRAGKDDSVTLTWETDKDGAIAAKNYSHPAQITKDEMAKTLASFKFSEYVFFQWRDQGRVFIEEEVEKLAEPVAKALAAANGNQWVAFGVTSYKRDLLFKTKRLTTGWMWVKDNKLNIVLGNFRFEMTHDEDPYLGDPRERYALTTYRIEPGTFFGPPALDPNDKMMRKTHNNWTVVDLDGLRAPAPEVKEPAEAPKLEAKSTEKRLTELKALLDKGLITQEEYEKKRKEILEKL